MSSTSPTRWAVIGPGNIARRFASQLPFADAELVAVGSSATPAGTERARAFAAEFAPGAFVGSYDDVLAREDVVLLPHVGSATTQTREAMGRVVLDNVDAFLERGELVTPVPTD